MANLAFPQLSSGAYVQYPIRRRRLIESVLNSFGDGTVIASNQNSNARLVWDLVYNDLTSADQTALQNLFSECRGSMLPFAFIDPLNNMLSYSTDLTASVWLADAGLTVTGGAADPKGGTSAFTLVNSSQIDRQLTQSLAVPANYQYCLSAYVAAPSASGITLGWSAQSSQGESFALGANWVRCISSGRLSDGESGINTFIRVPAGQTVTLFGPQLEAQIAPSRYRSTAASGGVYQNAHFLNGALTFSSSAPGLFSTSVSIELT